MEVGEVDPAKGLRVGGDGYDPGGGAAFQPVEEQLGEEERSQVVHGEGALQTVGGDVAGVPAAAGVGATSGIGKATALGLAAMGAQLAITGRDPRRTEAAAREISAVYGGSVDVFVADLSAQSELRRLAQEVLQQLPRIDVLINVLSTVLPLIG